MTRMSRKAAPRRGKSCRRSAMGLASACRSRFPPPRNIAVLLIDQLKQIYIDGELEILDTNVYFPKILRKDFIIGLIGQGGGPDPDRTLDLFYGCGSSLNWDGYCNAEVDKMIERQSIEARDPTLATVARDVLLSAGRFTVCHGRARLRTRTTRGRSRIDRVPTRSNPATQPGPRRERIGARRQSTGGNGRGSTDGNVRIIARRFTRGTSPCAPAPARRA
jgi:hypothetical protein